MIDPFLVAALVVICAGFIEILMGFRLLRFLGALFTVGLIHAELATTAVVRWLNPPRHAIVGECIQCGDCCKSIMSNPPRFMKRDPWRRWYIAFHRITHNFRPVARGPDGEIFFSCDHLRADNRCGIYWRRPLLCRTYPVLPYYDQPQLLPQCSYRVTARVVTQMRSHPSLPILNPTAAVYHPTPDSDAVSLSDYELIEMVPGDEPFTVKERRTETRDET